MTGYGHDLHAARGLDHIVHAVRDLDAGAALYRRLGFTVGTRNHHPWGTANHIVQMPGFFIEILTVADPAAIPGDGIGAVFGAGNHDYLRRGEGFSFLLLESQDAEQDAERFAKAKIAASPALTFTRLGQGQDGQPVTVGFALAFAHEATSPHAGFAVCRQHTPSLFWHPDRQHHDNGVTAVAGAVLVAENPSDHHEFLTAFTGVRDLAATSSGLTAATPRGDVQILDPTALRDRYGVSFTLTGAGLEIAGLRLTLPSRDVLLQHLHTATVAHHITSGGAVVIRPPDARGAMLVFEETARGLG